MKNLVEILSNAHRMAGLTAKERALVFDLFEDVKVFPFDSVEELQDRLYVVAPRDAQANVDYIESLLIDLGFKCLLADNIIDDNIVIEGLVREVKRRLGNILKQAIVRNNELSAKLSVWTNKVYKYFGGDFAPFFGSEKDFYNFVRWGSVENVDMEFEKFYKQVDDPVGAIERALKKGDSIIEAINKPFDL